jgi:cell division septation protein DedD
MRWTTIGLSAGTELAAANKEALAQAAMAEPVDWKKRVVSLWIPATLGLGLMMAFGYVGVRIVAGKPQVQPTTSPARPVPPKIEAPVNPPPAPLPKPAPPPPPPTVPAANFTVITPQPGERYLQVAAVSPHMVLTYVDNLRIANLDAVIAPGPTPDLLRVLVGPFADLDDMDKAKAQLQASGKSPIIRIY